MSTTPGEFPVDEVMSHHEDAQGRKFEFTWQDLGFASQCISERGWSNVGVPPVLQSLPENLAVGPQLQSILIWSMQRYGGRQDGQDRALSEPRSETQNESSDGDMACQAVPEAVAPSTPGPPPDSSETSTISSRTKARRMSPLLIRLKQLRSDVAAKMALKAQVPGNTNGAEQTPNNGECISCFDEYPSASLVGLPCSHEYCKPCLREVVLNARKTESAFPPKCCLTEIPLKTVLMCLENKQRDEYKEKSAEYAIPAGHRWYCPEPKCSKWIRPEKLQRNRRVHQTCPHCKANICSTCRSLAHDGNEDCPQDFGLDQTLEVAESEGWRRCYSCRTMVELTVGCRHITCRCGAEFCYVCNARWKTCKCTESDKERRIQELRTRREERDRTQQIEDEAAQAEADEIADIIAQVEEFERQESIRAAEEDERRRLEEELLLAELEETRLLEEIARRDAEEEAERQLRQVLLESTKEECQAMMKTLMQIINFQHAALMSEHAAREQELVQEHQLQRATVGNEMATLISWQRANVEHRRNRLDAKQLREWEGLLLRREQEEDDMFMHTHMYLRDKPNREQREKRMRDAFQQDQAEKHDEVKNRHDQERNGLEYNVQYEDEGLRKYHSALGRERHTEQFESSMMRLGCQIGCDRRWFQLISTRRIEMLKLHKNLVVEQRERIEVDQEPVGLSEEQALAIEPVLPTPIEPCDIPEAVNAQAIINELPTASEAASSPINTTQPGKFWSQQAFPNLSVPLISSNKPARSSAAPHLFRSDTITSSIPGAYPTSASSQRPNSTFTRRKPVVSTVFEPTFFTAAAQSSSKHPITADEASSMSNITTTSCTIGSRTPSSIAEPSLQFITGRDEAQHDNTSSSPSTAIVDAQRKASSTSTTASNIAHSADAIPDYLITGRGSVDSVTGKKRGLFGRGFGLAKRKEVREEEIRRRMSACVGDGFGV